MTMSVQQQVGPIGSKLVVETASDEESNNNVTGAPGKIYVVEVDNSACAADSFTKIYDRAAPIVGTDAPEEVIRTKAGQKRSWVCTEGWDFTCLSFATVTTPGTGGITPPTNPVIVRFVTT